MDSETINISVDTDETVMAKILNKKLTCFLATIWGNAYNWFYSAMNWLIPAIGIMKEPILKLRHILCTNKITTFIPYYHVIGKQFGQLFYINIHTYCLRILFTVSTQSLLFEIVNLVLQCVQTKQLKQSFFQMKNNSI